MRNRGMLSWVSIVLAAVISVVAAVAPAGADDAAPAFTAEMAAAIGNSKVMADTLWVLLTAMLVFFMNAGFGMLEAGLQQAKNCVNICAKNFVVFAISSLAFWFVGWGIMFGDGNGFMGLQGLWMLAGADNSPATGSAYQGVYGSINWTGVPLWAKFFFQLVFAGTAATIVSGSVGGRIKFHVFILFSAFLVGVMYPITGHWIWGGGWLAQKGFFDFAGSTVVHSVGGWAALAGAILLGSRIGKFRPDGSVNPIMGHNMLAATLGTLILWLGWFGFNPGSTMAADPESMARICVTTNMAAAAGTVAAALTAWVLLGKPDLSMILNGCLAGLVAITAPCAFVSVGGSIVIGAIAGVLVVFGVIMFDKLKVDDPVGATAVHLLNGVWGTLAVGLFSCAPFAGGDAQPKVGLFYGGGTDQLTAQLIGVVAVGAFTFILSLVGFGLLKAVGGIRVGREEELRGLDIGEHGMEAYSGFNIFLTK